MLGQETAWPSSWPGRLPPSEGHVGPLKGSEHNCATKGPLCLHSVSRVVSGPPSGEDSCH